jgi:hypothetical protein
LSAAPAKDAGRTDAIPFGYQRNDRKELVHDERTAPVIRRIFKQYAARRLELGADTPTTPDTATLHAIADRLDHVIANGEPEQAKALLAILIADLRINSRAEVLPTYRVGAPVVCAPTSSVEPTEVNTNRSTQVPGGWMSLDQAE